jgi:hypothetical protein
MLMALDVCELRNTCYNIYILWLLFIVSGYPAQTTSVSNIQNAESFGEQVRNLSVFHL